MMHDDVDRILAGEESVVPSSGFTASVMEAVRREAAAPPQIPFPWKRALPGLAACALTIPAAAVGLRGPAPGQDPLAAVLKAAGDAGAGWIAVALLLAYISMALSTRLAGGRT
jgi:hypothetical protein